MSTIHSTGYRWVLLLLFASGFTACQRAAFQFQPAASALLPIAVVAPAAAETLAVPRPRAATVLNAPTWPRRARRAKRLAQNADNLHVVRLPRLLSQEVSALAAARQPQQPGPLPEPVHHRSRGIALLLALLSITYVPFSLHNFYLGYYGRGAAAIALLVVGVALLFVGWPGFLFGGSLTAIGYVGLAMLGGWLLWQVSDFIRIITRDLQPKNGSYAKKSA